MSFNLRDLVDGREISDLDKTPFFCYLVSVADKELG
jgi:hypothetical protein